MAITLRVSGLGEITSFKNSKMIARGRLITDPRKQKQMERIIRSLKFQLDSFSRTTGGETLMDAQQQFLTVLLKQSGKFDDSWQWIPKLIISGEKCTKGEEGCIIEIKFHDKGK